MMECCFAQRLKIEIVDRYVECARIHICDIFRIKQTYKETVFKKKF